MSHPSPDDDARQALREEAERLRQQRLGAEATALEAARQDLMRREVSAAARAPARLRASLARFTLPALFASGTGVLFSLMFAGAADEDEGVHLVGGVLAALTLTALVGVLVRWRVLAPRRYRRWLATRPFSIEGLTDALSADRAAVRVCVWLVPTGDAPPVEVVRELLAARLPRGDAAARPPRVEQRDGVLAIVHGFAAEDANWPLHGWFVALADRVLTEVHRGWPLHRVRVEVMAHASFDVGNGD